MAAGRSCCFRYLASVSITCSPPLHPTWCGCSWAALFAGLCGASYTTANAYLADITKPEDRAKVFGYMGAAFGLGFIIGPAIGGILGEYGPRVPFFVAAGVSILNFAYGYFVLPETLPRESRRPFQSGPLQSHWRVQGLFNLQAGASAVHRHGHVFLRHIGLPGDLGVLGHCPLQLELK